MRVAIAGAVAGLSCAKYLTDAGNTSIVGVSVVNFRLWLECKLTDINQLLSRLPLLGVDANTSNTCRRYADPDCSMLELVLAPAQNWIKKSDEEILQATAVKLENLFLAHFGKDNPAKRLKYHVVKTPRSVYTIKPGRQNYRSIQQTFVNNFYLSGSYTMQPYLGSMEDAVLSGKLTAQAINPAHQSANSHSLQMQNIQPATNAATA
jgi:15-cis-phytoene desaturase